MRLLDDQHRVVLDRLDEILGRVDVIARRLGAHSGRFNDIVDRINQLSSGLTDFRTDIRQTTSEFGDYLSLIRGVMDVRIPEVGPLFNVDEFDAETSDSAYEPSADDDGEM